MKKTKIVCTLGPASESKAVLKKMLKAGMNVARLNFSHGSYAHHASLIKTIRGLAKELKMPLAIIQDLQGPRIRVGEVAKEGIELVRADKVIIYPEAKQFNTPKGYKILPSQFSTLYKFVKTGTHILINDGLIDLRVQKVTETLIYTQVVKPGIVFTHKGINLPGVHIKTKIITDKDQADLKFGLSQNVDYVALSFVHCAKDIEELRRLIGKNKAVKIIAKIETKEAVQNFDEILAATDAVMVARGDLGIELPVDQVPLWQKKMIRKCLYAAKPVIVATQMLESMMLNPRPTRAEVSDVANAVIDHTDAVMLSGETASGKYPVEAVSMMAQIVRKIEVSSFDDLRADYFKFAKYSVPDSIASSINNLVLENKAKAIIINSVSGRAARLVSRYRPEAEIIVLTNDERTRQRLALVWGVYAYLLPSCKTLDSLIKKSLSLVKKIKLVKKGQRLVIITGQPFAQEEGVSLVKVQTI